MRWWITYLKILLNNLRTIYHSVPAGSTLVPLILHKIRLEFIVEVRIHDATHTRSPKMTLGMVTRNWHATLGCLNCIILLKSWHQQPSLNFQLVGTFLGHLLPASTALLLGNRLADLSYSHRSHGAMLPQILEPKQRYLSAARGKSVWVCVRNATQILLLAGLCLALAVRLAWE